MLGSVLSSVYRGHLDLTGVPGPAADAVRGSVFAGLAVADELKAPALAHSVRRAFVAGVDASLLASAGFALLGVALALAFMPGLGRNRHSAVRTASPDQDAPAGLTTPAPAGQE